MKGSRNCASETRRLFFRKSRETRCFSAFITTDGVTLGGSLIKRCTWSGITTYPTNRKPYLSRIFPRACTNKFRARAVLSNGNRR
jgi:hypothetical protein